MDESKITGGAGSSDNEKGNTVETSGENGGFTDDESTVEATPSAPPLAYNDSDEVAAAVTLVQEALQENDSENVNGTIQETSTAEPSQPPEPSAKNSSASGQENGAFTTEEVGVDEAETCCGDHEVGEVIPSSLPLPAAANSNKGKITPPPSYAEIHTNMVGELSTRPSSEFIVESENANNTEYTEVRTEKWYTIDTYMLPAKLTYFCDQFKEASIWPYLVLFQVSIGLSTSHAGIVNGARFVGCLFGAPLWGMLADQKKCHRQLIMIICACAVVFQCSQPFWGEFMGPEDLNHCPTRTNLTLKQIEAEHKQGLRNTDKLFHVLLVVSVVACFFDGTTLTFVDSGVQRRIRATPRKIDFGRSRMFGSIGYGIGSVVSSTAIEDFPNPLSVTCYTGMFCVYFLISIMLIINFNFLYKGIKDDEEPEEQQTSQQQEKQPNVLNVIWKSLNFDVVFFLLTVLFNGLMRALVFSFTYLYLKELGGPTWLLGVSMVVSQVASLIMYALSEKIIELAGGTMQVMAFSCFTWVIRLLCLAYMDNYYLILPINALNGVSASLFVASSIIHVRKTVDPSAYTAMYGIRNALFNGGGYIIANIVGGTLYEMYGAKTLFLYTCMFCAAWVITMTIYIVYDKRKQKALMNRVESKGNDIALGDITHHDNRAAQVA